jgi:hypothetical protein
MRLALRYIVLSGIAFAASSFALHLQAQDRCGTVQYNKSLHPNYQDHKIGFERWLSERQSPGYRLPGGGRRQTGPYKIPVVVHIIHNGEAIGTGANIPEAQVLSQIAVLNEDFKRQNADAINTPATFAAVAGSLDIEFVLAKQDPDGLPSNGIVRVNGGRSGWTINDNYTLKALSYWPAEQYMNIWVCNLTDQFVGYAQHPESDLEGLENSSTNRLTDGIVIWHRAFGSGPSFSLDPAFNKGRTTTHETGHFFGLHHIWGDEPDCGGTDYVTDTPNQADRTQGCPTHPKTDKCGQVIMFQNYLDYTDDACMNLFTIGQVSRMTTVIENSPRRESLLTSPALQDPAPLSDDIGVRTIVFPDASVCSNVVTPVIELRNYGSNAITSARIRFALDGTTRETKDFALALDPQEDIQVSFNTLAVPSGSHSISFQVLLTNGGTDSGDYNDLKTSTVIVPAFATAPFAENFTSAPTGWITYNPDGQVTWQIVTAPKDTPANKALKLDYFGYEDKIGEVDTYLSPVLDLSAVPAATLTFEVAHARYQSSNDRLQVVALSNCQDISQGTIVYNKAGDELKTAPSTTAAYTPTGETQWRKELINLSAFVGMDKVQLAFVGINDWGNNIYVDNITLFTEETSDVALARMVTPGVVTCTEQIAPKLLLQNAGSVLLTDVLIDYTLNGGTMQTMSVTGLDVAFGVEKEITLPVVDFVDGENVLQVTVKDPNGSPDQNPANNSKTFRIVVNQYRERIPLREDFEDSFTPTWTTINPTAGMNWQTADTNFGQSIYFNSFNNLQIDDEAWLVTPVLDLSRTGQASMLFDLSYAKRNGASESLRILASTDCGVTYNDISYNFPSGQDATGSWVPQDAGDWNENVSVNLNSVAGQENVRIAFVVHNANANNLYLDNIEFFITTDPDPLEIEDLYAIYGYDLSNTERSDLQITFNLPKRQDVRFSIVNAIGQMETDGILSDVLNQTYPLNVSHRLPPGVYIIRLQIAGRFYSTRILVQ